MKNIDLIEMEISKIYDNLRKYSTGTGIKKKADIFGDKFLILAFFVFLIISLLSIITSGSGVKYIEDGMIIVELIFFCVFISTIIYRIVFYGIFRTISFTEKYRKITDNIYNHHLILSKSIIKQYSITEILEEINRIRNYILLLKRYRFIWKYSMTPTGVYYMYAFIKKEIEFINLTLLNLRSNLSSRLSEQQKSLESAKSEVEKNIGGTSALEEVSELQKARLDRQIEQFEELQKVLVKV